MSEPPSSLHLVERAARRLLETDGVASQLLRTPGNAPPPGEAEAPGPATTPDAAAPMGGIKTLLAEPLTDVAALGPNPTETVPLKPGIDAKTLKQAGMIDWSLNRERLSEEFRIVQAQVLQALAATTVRPPARTNIMMLTSARPGEGKTFSALNLAGALASCSPQKVILVDVDTKRHSLTTRLQLDARPGLLDMAREPHRMFDGVLVSTSLPNLRVLPVGQGEMQEPLSGGKPIIHVMERLGRTYADCIIVLDTPPCLSSSDPSTLAPVVGGVVMLIEAQQTQRAEVEAALDLIEACPTVVLLLNKVQLTGSDTFGAYGY